MLRKNNFFRWISRVVIIHTWEKRRGMNLCKDTHIESDSFNWEKRKKEKAQSFFTDFHHV